MSTYVESARGVMFGPVDVPVYIHHTLPPATPEVGKEEKSEDFPSEVAA